MEQPDPMPKEESSLAAGCALIFVGLLVFVPTGLCTGFFAVNAISNNEWSDLLVPAILGGLPAVGGAIIIWQGVKHFARYFRNSEKR